MAESFPPLPPELIEFAHGGRSLLVGTCSKDLEPECMRAMGIRVAPDGLRLTLFLPVATAEQTIANLRTNPRIALTLSEISTHRTLQIKGAVLEITEGTDEDHWYVNLYREMFAADLAWAGQSKANTIAVTNWPCHVVLVEIAVVYTQTPGPTAGLQLPVVGAKP